jgi:hypothetical protein
MMTTQHHTTQTFHTFDHPTPSYWRASDRGVAQGKRHVIVAAGGLHIGAVSPKALDRRRSREKVARSSRKRNR